MTGYRDLDPKLRQTNAAAAKKALVEKWRAAAQGPAADERAKERQALNEGRLARAQEREAARAVARAEQIAEEARLAKLAEEARLAAEAEAALLKKEEEERHLALLAEQKAKRDARYAERKAAKKVRRRGY